MPILSGSVTFARFRVEPAKEGQPDLRRGFVRGLKANAFEPLDRKSDEDRSAGFAELEDTDATEFAVSNLFYGERALFCWRVDSLRVPSAHVKDELKRWQAAFEKEHNRRPSKVERSAARANVRDALRKRAMPSTKTHDVAWAVEAKTLQIWTGSRKTIDEISVALESAFEVKLVPMIPDTLATKAGLADEALRPTAALVGVEVEGVHP
jgi:DNA recombination-dependent growth factor C